jgi:ADP-heptose:LPS heptosyltransferase
VAAVEPVRRLLALRALGLGDLLTAVPALRALADAFPGHRRVLACPRPLGPLALLSGAVDEVAHAEPLLPLPPSLRGVDVAVDLHGRGPESHRMLLALRPGRLIAFACPEAGVEGPRWRPDEHEVRRWCRLLEESGIAADAGRLDLPVPPIRLPGRLRGLTIVHPGAGATARRWPAERFAAVAHAQGTAGRRVAITGDRRESELAREVARLAGLPPGAALAGRTGLRDLAAIVAAARCVVSGDTGMAHLAVAMGTPSVTLFGPTSPALWGPPADRPRHVALWAGHGGDPHARAPHPGLLEIEVEDVLEAIAGLPEARTPRAAVSPPLATAHRRSARSGAGRAP